MEKKTYPRVLAIAGSDCSGGAGIQADIKAISATGSYAASAITAVTVQNTLGVRAVHNIPPEIVAGQIDAVLSDIGTDAVKIGMLSNASLIRCVREALSRNRISNIVLDPVMVATSGDRLLEESAVKVLSEELAPYARVLTPNIPEAEILSDTEISTDDDLRQVGLLLSERMHSISGQRVSVLMKAGHLDGDEVVDWFYNAEQDSFLELRSPRIHTPNTHGTGCTLSSAFASYLAQGYGLDDAARKAKTYISAALKSGSLYSIGHGHGPVDHFFSLR